MATSDIWAHFRQNYFMADRLPEYRQLLMTILERGYRFVPMADFARLVRGRNPLEGRLALLRIDVDSDPRGAARMFEVERELGIRSTYYFRLSTIDVALIGRMTQHGTEVGYHFEEASNLARRRGIRSAAEVERCRDILREDFRENVTLFGKRAGVTPLTVAAHGDFLNRKLGISNNFFIDDALLDELGIIAEAYQKWLVSRVVARIADRPPPQNWQPQPPEEVLKNTPAVLLLVMHPRQWVRNPRANACADIDRVWAETEYRLKRLRAGRSG